MFRIAAPTPNSEKTSKNQGVVLNILSKNLPIITPIATDAIIVKAIWDMEASPLTIWLWLDFLPLSFSFLVVLLLFGFLFNIISSLLKMI